MKITNETKWAVGLVGNLESKVHITKADVPGLKKYVGSIMRDVFHTSFHVHDESTAWDAAIVCRQFEDLNIEVMAEDPRCMLFQLNDILYLIVQLYENFNEKGMRKDFPNLKVEDHTACINECQHKPSKRN